MRWRQWQMALSRRRWATRSWAGWRGFIGTQAIDVAATQAHALTGGEGTCGCGSARLDGTWGQPDPVAPVLFGLVHRIVCLLEDLLGAGAAPARPQSNADAGGAVVLDGARRRVWLGAFRW